MDCKEYAHRYITADELLAIGACELSLLVPLAGGNVGDIRVHDGRDTSAPLRFRARMPANGSRAFHFNPHMYLQYGLYIEFQEQIDGCFVQWRMRPHGES